MVDCENFERHFQLYRTGGLSQEDAATFAEHAHSCPHCAGLTQEGGRLRALLSSLPDYQPRPGFEMRLNANLSVGARQRITYKPARVPLLPRWAAVGTGLATGLAVGVILLTTPHTTGNNRSAAPELAAASNIAEKDTINARKDSIRTGETPYDLDGRSEMVSGRR
jgi:anti-sigma factor RsiW